MAKKKWEPGRSVPCPCCGTHYQTGGRMPFSPDEHALHAAARRLVKAAKAVEMAWATGHLRTDPGGFDQSTIRGRSAMEDLRAAIAEATGVR